MKKIFWIACGTAALAASPVRAQDMSGFLGALGAMMGATNQQAAAVVDFRELKALLPEAFGAFKRTKAGGEKNSAMGMTIAQADGEYKSGGANITIKLMDYGGTGMAGMMAAGWSMSEVDRESDTGFERTTTIKGNKAIEKFDTQYKTGEIQILVAGRFMVEIEGRGCADQDLRAAADALDLAQLAALKK